MMHDRSLDGFRRYLEELWHQWPEFGKLGLSFTLAYVGSQQTMQAAWFELHNTLDSAGSSCP